MAIVRILTETYHVPVCGLVHAMLILSQASPKSNIFNTYMFSPFFVFFLRRPNYFKITSVDYFLATLSSVCTSEDSCKRTILFIANILMWF